MAECPEFVIWNVTAGATFCARSSAELENSPSDDYNAGIHIVEPGGGVVDWAKSELDPGPASLVLARTGGYGASGKLVSGPSGPTVTLQAWIEAADGSRPFDCTWTNSDAGTELRVSITIVARA